jgi:hypothetical protein
MIEFVDDVNDMEFEEFFGGKKKRQERLEKRLERREKRKGRRAERKDARNDARDRRRATRQGMSLEEYRANQDVAGMDMEVDGKTPTLVSPKFMKRPAKISQSVKSAIVDVVDEVDADVDMGVEETESFFEKNKTYLLIGAGLVGAFFLYKKFKK